MKNRKTKWFIGVCAIILFLILGSLIPGEPLSSRAMVVGIGIDLVDDNTLKVSIQILTNTVSSPDSASSSSRVISQEHQTITAAMLELGKITGLAITLTHCNVVILGRDLIESSHYYSSLNYVIINNYLSENALVFVSEDSAEEVLNSKTGFGNNASIYAQKVMAIYADYDTLTLKSIKELLIDYHQKGSAVWIPYLKRQPINSRLPSSYSEEGGGEEKETDYLFNIQEIVLLKKDTFLGVYNEASTSSLNYIIHNVKRATLTSKGDNNEDICFFVIASNRKTDFDWDKKTVKCTIYLQAILKEIVDYSKTDRKVDRSDITESELHRAERKVILQIDAFYSLLQELDLDLYAFEEFFYADNPKAVKDFDIKDIKFDVDVIINVN